jgi:hypothetical protein
MTKEEALMLYVLCSTYRALPGESRTDIRHIQQEVAAVLKVPCPDRHEDIGDFIRRFYEGVTHG